MLHLNDVVVRLGGRTILDGATLHLPAGGRYGLVGRNGAGKSTILRLIAGELQPDGGEVRLRAGVRIGSVAQEAPGGALSALDAVLAADRERADLLAEAETTTDPMRIGEAQTRLAEIGAHTAPVRAARVLKGLGFDEAMRGRPLADFSGGWRMRVALAGVLFAEPDLLLLDEPTNHLDLEATLWLQDYLRTYPRTLLIVSHDRELLNVVPERTVHLENGGTTLYAGNFDAFRRARAEKRVLLEKAAVKAEARRRHMQAFVDRFRYSATKARQAQSRLKALEKMERITPPRDEATVRLDFEAGDVPAPPLVTLDQVDVGYGGEPVLRRLSLRIDPDDRIALLGANGNGKSTFAKLIAGRLEPSSGEVVRAPNLRIGFFAQHQIEDLEPAWTPIEHLAVLLPDAREESLRARLGRFGLSREKAETRAGLLSGGEKARLTFALMSVRDPQVLILDEPTNHLDIESREALIETLAGFGGAVILISHDFHLLGHAADRLWLVGDGRVATFEGDLDDYRRRLLDAPASPPPPASPNGAPAPAKPAPARRRAELAVLRREAKAIEREMEGLSAVKADLDRRLADPATYADAAVAARLARESAEAALRLAAAEARWLAAAEAVEEA